MISLLVPVYNEEKGIVKTIEEINKELIDFKEYEIIAINDGSIDSSIEKIKELNIKNLKIINHVENQGYGKSLYDGILASKYNCIAIIDGDGSYPVHKIKELYKYYPEYDMIVGARTGKEYRRGFIKRPARMLFKLLVEYASGRKVPDANSGFRIFKKDIVMNFQNSLCTGFSFTTTLTITFLLNHYYVKYIPIDYFKREGDSKVKHFIDTLRAGQIIIETILYYNPTKLFLLLATLNLIFGISLEIFNNLFLSINFLTIISAINIASFIPIFSIGLLANYLKELYKRNKI